MHVTNFTILCFQCPRTPILSNGVESAKRSFEAAPKEITGQYDHSFIDYHVNMMTKTAEVSESSSCVCLTMCEFLFVFYDVATPSYSQVDLLKLIA